MPWQLYENLLINGKKFPYNKRSRSQDLYFLVCKESVSQMVVVLCLGQGRQLFSGFGTSQKLNNNSR